MAVDIILKKGRGVPPAESLSLGELAIDDATGVVYTLLVSGEVVPVNQAAIESKAVLDIRDTAPLGVEDGYLWLNSLNGLVYIYDSDAGWFEFPSSGGGTGGGDGIPEAPVDNVVYGRSNAAWVEIQSLGGGGNDPRITDTQITNWDTAYGWGDHSTAGYLTDFTETDPTVPDHVKAITEEDIATWNAGGSGVAGVTTFNNRSGNVTLTTEDVEGVFTEADPTVPQHVKDITQADIDKWNSNTGGGTGDSFWVADKEGIVYDNSQMRVQFGTGGTEANIYAGNFYLSPDLPDDGTGGIDLVERHTLNIDLSPPEGSYIASMTLSPYVEAGVPQGGWVQTIYGETRYRTVVGGLITAPPAQIMVSHVGLTDQSEHEDVNEPRHYFQSVWPDSNNPAPEGDFDHGWILSGDLRLQNNLYDSAGKLIEAFNTPPADGGRYVYKDGEWVLQEDAPSDGEIYGRQNETWVVVPSGGSNVDLTGYATETWVSANYQVKGNYLTASSLNGYATETWVGQNYQPKGNYLTSFTETDPTVPAHVKGITQADINKWNAAGGTDLSGYATETWVSTNYQPKGSYLTSSDLNGYATQSWVNSQGFSKTDTTYGVATSSTYGLVKIGFATSGKNYAVQLSSGKMYVNVPWTDTNTNTTYSAGNGLSLSGTQFKMSGSYTGSFTASGDVTAFSDVRLKEDINTLDGSKVFDMRGVSFTKNGKAGSGVIAQELQEIAPELVHDDDEYLSVAYGNLVGYLIESVKILKAEIEELKRDSAS